MSAPGSADLPGDDAVKGRGDLGVTKKRLIFLHFRLGRNDGGQRDIVFRLGRVNVLLRHEIGVLAIDLVHTAVNQMALV